MTRLLAVELSRLAARRAVLALLVVSILGLAAMVTLHAYDTLPPSPDELAAAEVQAEQGRAQCELDEAAESERAGEPIDFGCEFNTAENYLGYFPYDFVSQAPVQLLVLAVGLGLVAFLVGATFIGAEWSAGTVGQHLLYEPRRARVFASKALALATSTAVVAALSISLTLGALYAVASAWGSTAGLGSDRLADLVGGGLRAAVLVGGLSLAAFALATLVRSTAVAIGALAAYAIGAEAVLRGVWPDSEPWLVSNNVFAWVQGGYEIVRYDCDTLDQFGGCTATTQILSTSAGAIYLGVGLVILVGASLLAFRRRDVT